MLYVIITVYHYVDVIMTTVASQITSLAVVYSIVYSGADERKHQSSASLAFVRGIHRDRWIPRTNGQLRGKCFHLMTSSWLARIRSGSQYLVSYGLNVTHEKHHCVLHVCVEQLYITDYLIRAPPEWMVCIYVCRFIGIVYTIYVVTFVTECFQ